MFEKYIHHGKEVSARKDLKGKHREYCLCFSCQKLDINNSNNNCFKAKKLYELCKVEGITTVVFECSNFIEK